MGAVCLGNEQALDALDRRMLRALAAEGRISARKLGAKLGAATSTVSARMAWLERKGIIKGYGARIDYGKLGYEWVTLVEIIARKGGIREAETKAAKLENVFAVYDLTGETDCMALARFRTRAELDAFVKGLQEVKGIERTITHIVLNTVKDEPDSTKP
jgi:DNA-binding Lrp family transcriptional regulator